MAWRTTGVTEYAQYQAGTLSVPTTMMAWVQVLTDPTLGIAYEFYETRYTTTNGWRVYMYGDGSSQFHFCVFDDAAVRSDETVGGRTLNTWYHAALVLRSGTSNNIELYVNGTSVLLASDAGGISGQTGIRLSGNTDGFDIRLCGVKVWSGVELTAEQIQAEMRSSRPRTQLSNLWAWYPLLQGGGVSAGTTMKCQAGVGPDLAITGTTEYESESPPFGWGASPLWILAPTEAMVWYNHDGVKPWSSVWRSGRF